MNSFYSSKTSQAKQRKELNKFFPTKHKRRPFPFLLSLSFFYDDNPTRGGEVDWKELYEGLRAQLLFSDQLAAEEMDILKLQQPVQIKDSPVEEAATKLCPKMRNCF